MLQFLPSMLTAASRGEIPLVFAAFYDVLLVVEAAGCAEGGSRSGCGEAVKVVAWLFFGLVVDFF